MVLVLTCTSREHFDAFDGASDIALFVQQLEAEMGDRY